MPSPASRPSQPLSDRPTIESTVRQALATTPITDIHTHLYPPQFGDLLLWGLDELLTYHYLVAEFFRASFLESDPRPPITYDDFWSLPKPRQAELIWDQLFIRRSPLSEACRGVLTCLRLLDLDPAERDLNCLRSAFAAVKVEDQVDRVLARSGVRHLIMTNDSFDPAERPFWSSTGDPAHDPRFRAALRLDQLLLATNRGRRTAGSPRSVSFEPASALAPAAQPGSKLSTQTLTGLRRYLGQKVARMQPAYLAISLPPEFRYPADSFEENSVAAAATRLLDKCILPLAAEHGLPLALMLGCRKQINPALRLAGDSVGRADLTALTNLCAAYPQQRFLCTVLARENQHELAVIARKFRNLHIFGCWWFLNTPSLIDEITRLRLELLGPTFTPQHSDARVLEQLLYKWAHTREVLADVLTDKYADLAAAGRPPTAAEVARDVAELLGGAAERFLGV